MTKYLQHRHTDDGEDHTAAAFDFITGLLVEGRATAGAQATLKVLCHLADSQEDQSESSFVAVLQTAGLQGMCSAAPLLRLLSSGSSIAVLLLLQQLRLWLKSKICLPCMKL